MSRSTRIAPGNVIYHVLNRGNARQRIFHKPPDYQAFLQALDQTRQILPVRILAYCLMPNHWHLVLWPRHDGDLSNFMLRLTTTHVRRYFSHYPGHAGGHLYQGRFKNFPVQDDLHLLTLLRYVEANPLRSHLVPQAEQWKWSSLYLRQQAQPTDLLHKWPIPQPPNWLQLVNEPLPAPTLEHLHTSLTRGRPFGSPAWTTQTCKRLALDFTLHPRGRPPI